MGNFYVVQFVLTGGSTVCTALINVEHDTQGENVYFKYEAELRIMPFGSEGIIRSSLVPHITDVLKSLIQKIILNYNFHLVPCLI